MSTLSVSMSVGFFASTSSQSGRHSSTLFMRTMARAFNAYINPNNQKVFSDLNTLEYGVDETRHVLRWVHGRIRDEGGLEEGCKSVTRHVSK